MDSEIKRIKSLILKTIQLPSYANDSFLEQMITTRITDHQESKKIKKEIIQ